MPIKLDGTRCYYELDCVRPYTEKFIDEDAKLIDLVGQPPGSSGVGFGLRDMQWQFETLADAEAAMLRIKDHVTEVGVTHIHWNDLWGDNDDDTLMYPQKPCSD